MKINNPGGHLDQMLRQTRAHHVQLSSMADILGVSTSFIVLLFSKGI